MRWPKIKKIVIFKCCPFLFYATTINPFLIGLWRETKSRLYMTTGDDQLSGWTEKKLQNSSQSQTCNKKKSWSLSGGLLPIWSTTAFWILGKPLHPRSMLSKLMRCIKNCNYCSQHWSTERAQFFSTTTTNCMSHNQPMLQKLNKLGYWVDSLAIFTWPLTNHQSLLQESWQLFAAKMLPQPVGGRKYFPRLHRIPRHRFFHYRNKQTYFSLGKICWL